MSRDVLGPAQGPRDQPAAGASPPLALPIALRLPNPPPHLVGRRAELRRLRETLEAATTAAVVGPAGIGKTALALATLDVLRREDRLTGPATLVTVDAVPPGHLVVELLDILGRSMALPPDWRVLGADRQLALATLIDLADAGPWVILLDDAHPAHEAELDEVLLTARDYARRSRWVLTARQASARLRASIPLLRLGAIDDEALLRLSHQHFERRGPAEHRCAVAECEGNPRRLLVGARASRAGDQEQAVTQFVTRMARLERPLAPAVIAAVMPLPPNGLVDELVREGQLARLPRGLWLRRDLAGSTATPSNGEELAAELAAGLEVVDDDDACLEAVRLWLRAGRAGRAVELLTKRGELLCERGLAADLWTILNGASRPGAEPEAIESLDRWRAWAAFEWGDPRAAAHVSDESSGSYLGELLRARVCLAGGRLQEATAAARRAAELAPSQQHRQRALCRAARALFSLGRPAEVLELVARCRRPEGDVAVEVAILRAEALMVLERPAESRRLCEQLLDGVSDLSPGVRLRALLGVARIYLAQQRLREGERTLSTLLTLRAERAGDAVSGRTALELSAAVALLRARFSRLREVGRRLLVLERAYPVRALYPRAYLITADEWQRSPRVFRDGAERLRRDAGRWDSRLAADVGCYAVLLCARSAMNAGEPPTTSRARPTGAHGPTPHEQRSCDAVLSRWRSRWGKSPSVPAEPEDDVVEHAILFALAHGTWHLARRQPERAERTLQRATERARETGYRLHEIDIFRTLALTHWSARDWTRLGDAADTMLALANQLEAPRLADEAAFFAASRGGHSPPPERLEVWAHDEDAAGTRLRWSRWLLGGEPRLDPLERHLLERSVQLDGWARATTVGGTADAGEWCSGAGLDHGRRLVWTAGRTVDLSRHAVLWSLLSVLAARRGAASKEELVDAVWDVAEYHPLKHDNRLRLAVRKLRQRLGDGPGRIETLDDGYALGGTWRLCGEV